jgi:beta-glucosidase-like glycosyl hydrolase
VTTSEHKEIALQIAKESIVMLKNDDNVLPLNL